MTMNKLPLARTVDIVVQDVGKEVLIYDLNANKAYALNETSTIVYQTCDGKTSFDQLKRWSKLTDDLIFLALNQLEESNLVGNDKSSVSPFAGMSRREIIRKVGFASMVALPIISSLIVPTAAQCASTCKGAGETVACTSSGLNCSTFASACCSGSASGFSNTPACPSDEIRCVCN